MKKESKNINSNIKEETIEIDYQKASTKAIFASNLFDGFAMLLLAFLLLLLNNFIFSKTPLGIQTKNQRDDIILSSYLYEKKDDQIKDVYSIVTSDEEMKIDDKNTKIDSTLTLFFTSFVKDNYEEGMKIYNDYKKEAKSDEGKLLFAYDEKSNSYIKSKEYTNIEYDNLYYNFYTKMLKEVAPGYLTSSKPYRDNLRTSIIQNAFIIYLSIFISCFIFYYMFPLIFKRGRQTLGMKILHIGLVDVKAMSVSLKRFTLRYLFFIVVIITLSIVSFLLPILISTTMLIVSKTSQSLTDYVFNTYKVDTSSSSIYLNEAEYHQINEEKENISILDIKTKL